MSCSVGCRQSLDPMLLWLRHRLVAAVLIQPLAHELSYTAGAAVKKKKNVSLELKTESNQIRVKHCIFFNIML